MSSKHMTKQELRHDSFVEGIGRLTAWLQNNFMTVLIGLAAIVLLIVVGVFFRQSSVRNEVQAEQAFFRVTSRYAQGAYSDALTECETVFDSYAGRKQGKWALYFAGASHLALTENDRAIERFDEYLAQDSSGQYVPAAHLGKALALEAKGELDNAVSLFAQVRAETEVDEALHVQAALGETRSLQALGRVAEAIAVLEPLLTEADPQSRVAIEARLETLRALSN